MMLNTNLWSWWRCLLFDTDSESSIWFNIGGGSVRMFFDKDSCIWAIWKWVRLADVDPFVFPCWWWWWCCCCWSCWTVLFLLAGDNGFDVVLNRDFGDNVDDSLSVTFSNVNNETLLTKYLWFSTDARLVVTVDVSTSDSIIVACRLELSSVLLKFDCTWLTKYLLFNWFDAGGGHGDASNSASFIDDIDLKRWFSDSSISKGCVVP